MRYPRTFADLAGWGSIRDSVTSPIKKVLGKKLSAGISTGISRYGLTAVAAAATIASGGLATPALVAAAAAAAATTVVAEREKAAQRAAKREALRLAKGPTLTDAELDQLPDYDFPPGSITDANGRPIQMGGSTLTVGRLALVGVPILLVAGAVWLLTRKR